MFKLKNDKKVDILGGLLSVLFLLQRPLTKFKNINYPENSPCIFALWHAHQCASFAIKDHSKLYVLASKSNDGEIVARASKAIGLKMVRGSQNRDGAAATLSILEKLEQGNDIAITIDGPRGPKYVVKKGVINIAKLSQVPIVPLTWHTTSPTLLKLNTWDELRFPLSYCRTLALYGEPIYVPGELDEEGAEFYRLKLENALKDLNRDAIENFETYMRKKAG